VQILSKILWENGVLSKTRLGRRFRTRDVDALNYSTGTELIVRFSRPEEIQLDGDGFGRAVALKTWIKPGSLTVRVPNDA
jgi:diacylglycerol kinase (ATP)